MSRKSIFLSSTLKKGKKTESVPIFVTYLIKNKKRCQETLYSPFFFVSLPYKTINSHITVAQLTEMLQEFFAQRPGETLSFKEIFRSLHLTTHPLKMLAIDVMEEMAWDDYLAKVSDNSYRLNQSIQVMEGKFIRKANGKNSVIPDNSENPIFVSERNSMGALNGDRVEFTFLARRKNHIKEAQVNKILERAKDTFVGRLKVDNDLAYLVTPSDVFAHNIIIPRRKVKGGKTDDKAVVRIIEWPDGENKSPIGEVVDILGQIAL